MPIRKTSSVVWRGVHHYVTKLDPKALLSVLSRVLSSDGRNRCSMSIVADNSSSETTTVAADDCDHEHWRPGLRYLVLNVATFSDPEHQLVRSRRTSRGP